MIQREAEVTNHAGKVVHQVMSLHGGSPPSKQQRGRSSNEELAITQHGTCYNTYNMFSLVNSEGEKES